MNAHLAEMTLTDLRAHAVSARKAADGVSTRLGSAHQAVVRMYAAAVRYETAVAARQAKS